MNNGLRFDVLKRDNFTCRYCGAKAPETVLNVDHVIPRAKGGKDDPLNLVTACFDCNHGKFTKGLGEASAIDQLTVESQRYRVAQHRENVRQYLAENKALEKERQTAIRPLLQLWKNLTRDRSWMTLDNEIVAQMAAKHGHAAVEAAMHSVGKKANDGYVVGGVKGVERYMWGALRSMQQDAETVEREAELARLRQENAELREQLRALTETQ